MVYLRILRASSGVLYDPDFRFDFGKGYSLRATREDQATIISSGRGVFEALAAAQELEKSGICGRRRRHAFRRSELLLDLYDSGRWIILAEQNNGFIWSHLQRILFRTRKDISTGRLISINTLGKDGRPRFIHSATYPELLDQFHLAPHQLAERIRKHRSPNEENIPDMCSR